MRLDQYQQLCFRTFNPALSKEKQVLNFAMGLVGEAGEIADEVKKIIFHGHPVTEKLEKEFGDLWWYLASTALVHNIKLSNIFEGFQTFEELDESNPPTPISFKNQEVYVDYCLDLISSASELARISKEMIRKKDSETRLRDAIEVFIYDFLSLGQLLNINHTKVTEQNIEKLKKRFPNGFSSEDSQNRTE